MNGDTDSEDAVQGVFDFETGNTDGYANWRREQEAWLEAIRREWAVPVGRNVRLRLHNIDGEFVGKLELASLPVTIDRRVPLRLRVDRVDVHIPDIESCTVVEP